jgi:hypothetical protein
MDPVVLSHPAPHTDTADAGPQEIHAADLTRVEGGVGPLPLAAYGLALTLELVSSVSQLAQKIASAL